MKINNIGGFKRVNAYVEDKLKRFRQADRSFDAMFELMFSERENILFEKSEGYRIVKTTYGEAYEEVWKKAARIKELLPKAPRNSVVGLHMSNSVEWIEVFWAILAAGFRPLLMNLRLDPASLENSLQDVAAVAVISDEKTFSVKTILMDELAGKVDSGKTTEGVCENKRTENSKKKINEVTQEKKSEGSEIRKNKASQEKISERTDNLGINTFGTEIFVMSSGTTEHIKLCAYSAEEFYYLIIDSYHIMMSNKLIKKHYEGEMKLLTFLPFYHVFGLIAVYVWFAFFSRTFVQLNDMAPATILNTIRRHKVTHIYAVPMFWEKVYSQAIKTIRGRGEETYQKFQKGLKISEKVSGVPILGNAFKKKIFEEVRRNLFGESIVFLITGGSEIDPEVLRFFNGIGYHLANGYGMTEIGITSVELSSKDKILNAGFVGKPFSSAEYKISEEGELLVKGKASAKYILEGGKEVPKEEWFHTRDLAEERNGHYLIKGRMDDVVISPSGENLNPNVIEPGFRMDDVRNVCLIGERNGDKITPVLLISVNFYLSSAGMEKLDVAVKERIKELNLDTQISRVVYTDDSLIEENDFKLKRTSISRKWKEGKYHILIPGEEMKMEEGVDNEKMDRIRLLFSAVLEIDAENISYGADFFLDCGGSSLDYFALCAELQKEFGVEINPSEGESLKTVKDFYDYIIRRE